MTEDKYVFEEVMSFEHLYTSYRKAKAGKHSNRDSLKFQASVLDGIFTLRRMLIDGTYRVDKYNQFVVYEPKERIVKACSFKDKIVQHCLCDYFLIPKIQQDFILDNYAGQIGKGTLFGLDRLREQMLAAYEQYGMNCWILQADISKFFYSIDRDLLKDMIGYHVSDLRLLHLCELFGEDDGEIGIPLGNQVSQVYALLYLSGLDHFIKGELGIKFYGRYMDDLYIIAKDKSYLSECLYGIEQFCDSLHLKLNGKTQLIPFRNGIKFCGFHTYITSDGKAIRRLQNSNKRVACKKYRKMARLVCDGKISEQEFFESYNAWKNHISHGNCIKLAHSMDECVEEILKHKRKDGKNGVQEV